MRTVDIEKQIEGHEARNRELIKRITELGGDLNEVRIIDIFFFAQGEKSAYELANELKQRGSSNIDVNEIENKTDFWSVQGELNISVNKVVEQNFTEELVTLAADFSSKYDGWGTKV